MGRWMRAEQGENVSKLAAGKRSGRCGINQECGLGRHVAALALYLAARWRT